MIRIGSKLAKSLKYLGPSVSTAIRDVLRSQSTFSYEPIAGFSSSNKGTNDPYNILGVGRSASQDEVKQAYFSLAHKYHPDKGGDSEKFKEVQGAYEILGNPERRQKFDTFGFEGVANDGYINPFSDFFASAFKSRKSGPKKTATIKKTVSVKLESFFHGDVISYGFSRKKNCQTCKGYGSTKTSQCQKCNGAGIVMETKTLAPGFITQSQKTCSNCNGIGVIIDKKHSCSPCGAKGQIDSSTPLQIVIEPGMPCQSLIFEEEADEAPGHVAGDVEIILEEEKHPVFTRKGADLLINKKITLYEALTGVFFQIDHLDGSKIDVMTLPGEIIEPGTKKQLLGKGMPFYKNPTERGNLYIEFDIQFPQKGQIKNPEKLKGVLPDSEQAYYSPEKSYVPLQEYNQSTENPNPKGGKENEEEGPRVNCNQQ